MNITRVICAGVLLLAGSAAAQDGGKPIQKTTISLGTATPGGGFPLFGNAFAQVMNDADPTLVNRAAQHQGQLREYSAARSRSARYRAGCRRTLL